MSAVVEALQSEKIEQSEPVLDQRLGSRLDTLLTDRGWKRACFVFLFLGVVVRLVRYLLCFPLWNDEMALVENFLNRDWLGLLDPLNNGQVAPVLFMWTELAITKVAGVSEYSLRLFPVSCAIAGLFLFYHFASQYLKGLPLLMAVAVFSVSYYPIRHSAEAKPYAVDNFIAVLLLVVVTRYWKSGQLKWLLILTAMTPLALGYSFPSVFILGGISLSLMMPAFFRGNSKERILFVMFNVCLLSTFLLIHLASTKESYQVQFDGIMGVYWADGFVPLNRPWMIPVWFLKVCTSYCFEFPFGGDNGSATLPFLGLVVGCVFFFKRRHSQIVMLGGGVLLLALIASAMQRYPFGGHARLMQYTAPLACLYIGLGFVEILQICRPIKLRKQYAILSLGVLATIPMVVSMRDIIKPYKRIHYQQHREIAHRLWNTSKPEDPLYCLMESPDYAPTWEHFPYRCSQIMETQGDFLTLPAREDLDPSATYRAVVWYRIRDAKKSFPRWKKDLEQQFVVDEQETLTINAAEYTETFVILNLQPRSQYTPPEMTASKMEQGRLTQ